MQLVHEDFSLSSLYDVTAILQCTFLACQITSCTRWSFMLNYALQRKRIRALNIEVGIIGFILLPIA